MSDGPFKASCHKIHFLCRSKCTDGFAMRGDLLFSTLSYTSSIKRLWHSKRDLVNVSSPFLSSPGNLVQTQRCFWKGSYSLMASEFAAVIFPRRIYFETIHLLTQQLGHETEVFDTKSFYSETWERPFLCSAYFYGTKPPVCKILFWNGSFLIICFTFNLIYVISASHLQVSNYQFEVAREVLIEWRFHFWGDKAGENGTRCIINHTVEVCFKIRSGTTVFPCSSWLCLRNIFPRLYWSWYFIFSRVHKVTHIADGFRKRPPWNKWRECGEPPFFYRHWATRGEEPPGLCLG